MTNKKQGLHWMLSVFCVLAVWGLLHPNRTDARVFPDNGWYEYPSAIEGQPPSRFQYYKDGRRAIFWHRIDGQWYYFGESGYLATHWHHLPERDETEWWLGNQVPKRGEATEWYYFDPETGAMLTGWQYVLDQSGSTIGRSWLDDIVPEIGVGKSHYLFAPSGTLWYSEQFTFVHRHLWYAAGVLLVLLVVGIVWLARRIRWRHQRCVLRTEDNH